MDSLKSSEISVYVFRQPSIPAEWNPVTMIIMNMYFTTCVMYIVYTLYIIMHIAYTYTWTQ